MGRSVAVRTLASQYDEGYIYTYSDLDESERKKVNVLDISGRRADIGRQIINKGLLNGPLNDISSKGKAILEKSIKEQEAREKSVYSALGVSGGDVKTLSDNLRKALFGEFADEVDYGDGKGPTRRMDEVFTFLRDYLKEVVYKDAEAIGENTTDVNSIINTYNKVVDPAGYLTDSLEKSKNSGFLITDLKKIEDICKKKSKKENELLSVYNNLRKQDQITSEAILDILQVAKHQANSTLTSSSFQKYITLKQDGYHITLEGAKSLVIKYSKIAKRAVTGDIGEKLFSYFVDYNRNKIEQGVCRIVATPTSDWAGDTGEKYQINKTNLLKNYLSSHYDNHPLLSDFITVTSMNHASSLLPKEDVAIDILLDEGKLASLIFSGVSIKTSFYEGTNEDFNGLTIQSSSFRSFLQNLFYVPSNCLGDAATFYQALLKIVMNLAGEVGWNESGYNFQEIMAKAINYFAYVWFTGVISDEGATGHSDFFFVYKNRKTYLIPMSAILQKVLDAMEGSNFLLKEDPALWRVYSFSDTELAALDLNKGGAYEGYYLKATQEYALSSSRQGKKIIHRLSQNGQIKLSNFPNLVQGMGL